MSKIYLKQYYLMQSNNVQHTLQYALFNIKLCYIFIVMLFILLHIC